WEPALRPAGEEDIPIIRALAERIWRAHYPGIITPAQIDYMLALMYAEDVLRDEMRNGVIHELILADGAPVGFLSCTHELAERALKLNKLYLLPEQQGRGLGRVALEHVKEKAVGLGARRIYLQVNKRNT